jgi:hypothetical protein
MGVNFFTGTKFGFCTTDWWLTEHICCVDPRTSALLPSLCCTMSSAGACPFWPGLRSHLPLPSPL